MKRYIDAMKIARDGIEEAAKHLQSTAQEIDTQIKEAEKAYKDLTGDLASCIIIDSYSELQAVLRDAILATNPVTRKACSELTVSQRARERWYEDMLKQLDSDSNRYAPFGHGTKNKKGLKEMGVGTLEHEVEWLIKHEQELFKRLTKPTNYCSAHDWLLSRPLVMKMLAEIDRRS